MNTRIKRIKWWISDHVDFYLIAAGGIIAVAFLAVAGSVYWQMQPHEPSKPTDPGTAILIAACMLMPYFAGRPTPASQSDVRDLKREIESLTRAVESLRSRVNRG